MKVLDLFSGIGGFSVGLERAGFETVAFCEIEEYPRAVLREHWPDVPIYGDIRELTGERLRSDGVVPDVICGGYPCQPFSVAGKQKAEDDPRHLWPEMFRLIRECRPRWVICENVSGHVKLGLDTVLDDLEGEGYTCWTFIIPACAVGAPHKRDRLWIVGYAEHNGSSSTALRGQLEEDGRGTQEGQEQAEQSPRASRRADDASVANANGDDGRDGRGSQPQERETRLEHRGGGQRQPVGEPRQVVADTEGEQGSSENHRGEQGGFGEPQQRQPRGGSGWTLRESHWASEPNVGRVADGVPNRAYRIKGLGNAVVPQIPQVIGETIRQYEESRIGR